MLLKLYLCYRRRTKGFWNVTGFPVRYRYDEGGQECLFWKLFTEVEMNRLLSHSSEINMPLSQDELFMDELFSCISARLLLIFVYFLFLSKCYLCHGLAKAYSLHILSL